MKARRHKGTKARRGRRGIALIDVLVGGIMLGIGLSVILTVTSRALSRQTDGEKRLVASWLADELLSMVLVEGPDMYGRLYDTSGTFGPPFDDFAYIVDIEDQGIGVPYLVSAVIRWPSWNPSDQIEVQTLIDLPRGEPDMTHAPPEPLDREDRYLQMEEEREGR
jgi:hypothetical protein